MPKQYLFEELQHSLEDVQKFEQSKMTLKTTTIVSKERKILNADEIRAIQNKYRISRVRESHQ